MEQVRTMTGHKPGNKEIQNLNEIALWWSGRDLCSVDMELDRELEY